MNRIYRPAVVGKQNSRSYPFGGSGAAAEVPDARGLRDWDISELINQGLPFHVKSTPTCSRNCSIRTFSFPSTRGRTTLYHLRILSILPFSGKSRTLGRRRLCFGGSGASAASSSLLYF
jgi:hypothetical protein